MLRMRLFIGEAATHALVSNSHKFIGHQTRLEHDPFISVTFHSWVKSLFIFSSSTSPQETYHNVKPGGKTGKNDVEERFGHQNQGGFLRTREWETGS